MLASILIRILCFPSPKTVNMYENISSTLLCGCAVENIEAEERIHENKSLKMLFGG
jgi:hypothetical protein